MNVVATPIVSTHTNSRDPNLLTSIAKCSKDSEVYPYFQMACHSSLNIYEVASIICQTITQTT